MGKPGDKNPAKKPPPERGGVSRDASGKAVWQWAVDSGKHLIDSTTHLLKRLDVPGLKLEEDAHPPAKKSAEKPGVSAAPKVSPKVSAGYDPYGHHRGAPRARPAATKPVEAPEPRRSWWQRLFRRD